MDRRDFLKISGLAGATAALEGCGNPDHQLIRFIPEEDLIPGIATSKPSICTLCPAGCGLIVRVMQGEAEVTRDGRLGLLKMGLAKKLEGNPAHPINQGKLCPRGQAGLQVTYHPDRLKGPLGRVGPRGQGQFGEMTWDTALRQLVSQLSDLQLSNQESGLALITPPLRGQKKTIFDAFANHYKKPLFVESAFFGDEVIRAANAASFGQALPPTLDLAQSNYVLSFGADFLGTWNSPVAQAIGYGHMRTGRPGQRAKFVQFEQRISQTGASADEWIFVQPGTEGLLALALAHVIMAEKLRPAAAAGHAGSLIDGWSQALPDYAPEEIAERTSVKAETISRLAREAAAHGPAVAVAGNAATAQTNGLFNALAVNALSALLGSVGQPGGITFSPAPAIKESSLSLEILASQLNSGAAPVKVLLLYGANPVFTAPLAWGLRAALDKVPFIASFSNFMDETTALADLILPDHSPLESWLDDLPVSGSTRTIVSVAPPAMKPLHDTRATPDVLLDVAHQLGGDLAKALPWRTYDEAIQTSFAALYKEKGSKTAKDADQFWTKAQEQGGWWSAESNAAPVSARGAPGAAGKAAAPHFDGEANDYPFHFVPFASQLFFDGSLANLPWMQEVPDPLTTVMWGTWVELNPRAAQKLSIQQGDLLEVSSPHGKLRAPALINPGISPDVVAMPVGQGHEHFTRYASRRGANPVSILSPLSIEGTHSFAWAATRVKLSVAGRGKPTLFGASLREASAELEHR